MTADRPGKAELVHTRRIRPAARALAILLLAMSVLIGLTSTATVADEPGPVVPSTDAPTSPPSDEPSEPVEEDTETPSTPAPSAPAPAEAAAPEVITGDTPHGAPYGADYPVTLESNFARPYRSISSAANSDFSQLDDLERLIRGTYLNPNTGKLLHVSERTVNYVYITVSRMENSYRVGRELIKAAQHGVTVKFIHGEASQSQESRALQKKLNSITYGGKRTGYFKICAKGKSLACLSTVSGAIMHTKMLVIGRTFTQEGKQTYGTVWSGSANLGGPSGERTYNNGLTVYNDRKMFYQMRTLFNHMYREGSVGNDMIHFLKVNASSYGVTENQATSGGYTEAKSRWGMFYSNLANVTIYPTPIAATPTNGKDPVLNLLNRVVPDAQCRIRLQQNRFKYRRIAVAYKLAELTNQGCQVSIVSFEDDLVVNRIAHCQQYLRVCRPILDVFKTANRRIDAYWAKPHDKTILVDALLTRNTLNPEEIAADGTNYWHWGDTTDGSGAVRTRLVQAGSAALTGSNLIASDEITTETTDSAVYDEYLQHWKAILQSQEIHAYPY